MLYPVLTWTNTTRLQEQVKFKGTRYIGVHGDPQARTYAIKVAWWATSVEAVSSFNRLCREKSLSMEGKQQAMSRLAYLRRCWNEIQPTDEVRDSAERLLNVHKLRAADALQLSAALVWCNHRPRGKHFIGADGDLANAAIAKGFTVVRLL